MFQPSQMSLTESVKGKKLHLSVVPIHYASSFHILHSSCASYAPYSVFKFFSTQIDLDLVLQSTLVPQLDQLLNSFVERYNDATLLRLLVITVSPVDSPSSLFLSTDNHDEVV